MPELPNAQIISDQMSATPAPAPSTYVPLVVVDNVVPLPAGVFPLANTHDPYFRLEEPATIVDPNMPLV